MKASPPSQHRCHQTAAPHSSLVFLREDYRGLERSNCVGVRCETISLLCAMLQLTQKISFAAEAVSLQVSAAHRIAISEKSPQIQTG